MKDLKIKPGMDTPKAKLKNPAPKDADSLLKKHMDKRQREKEPESHDPVRYATDRVEKNMRHGASGAADASRRMIKHYRGKLRHWDFAEKTSVFRLRFVQCFVLGKSHIPSGHW